MAIGRITSWTGATFGGNQAVVVAVGHDHPADHPGRGPPACSVATPEWPSRSGTGYGSAGEVRSEIVRGAGLQRLAVLHHGFYRVGSHGAREVFVLRLLASDDRHGQDLFGEGAVDLQHAHGLRAASARRVGGMALLPEEFRGAQERAGALLPAHHVGPLVDQIGRSRQDCTHLEYIEQKMVSDVGRMNSLS